MRSIAVSECTITPSIIQVSEIVIYRKFPRPFLICKYWLTRNPKVSIGFEMRKGWEQGGRAGIQF